jgi:pimeloyl-ACP methyl ester carboxylesterase
MPYAGVNGQRLYYEVAGDGELVLLLHGSFADADLLEAPATGISSGFRALRIDRRGHGRSGDLKEPVAMADEVADLTVLLDWFSVGSAHLLGHDDGADVAIAFALAHPDRTLSLGLLSPTVEGYPWSAEAAVARSTFLKSFASDPGRTIEERFLTSPAFDVAREREGVFDRLADLYRRARPSGSSLGRPPHAGATAFERLGTIRAKTGVFVGEQDKPERLTCAAEIAHRIPGATLTAFPGLSRFFHIEDPRLVMRKLNDFYMPDAE